MSNRRQFTLEEKDDEIIMFFEGARGLDPSSTVRAALRAYYETYWKLHVEHKNPFAPETESIIE